MDKTLNPFLLAVMEKPGGDKVQQCIQCATCSGSCPVIEEMEYGPRRIMYLIQSGAEEQVLSSHDMWYCVSCYSCTSRCPREIPITELMASLRELAGEKGYAEDKEAQFGQAFAETYQHHGRLFEPELMLRYYLRSWDIKGLLGMVPLALPMLLKDKLPFWPERIENPTVMTAMCQGKVSGEEHSPKKRSPWWSWSIGALLASGGAICGALLWMVGRGLEEEL
ncbi:MAG TPA: 4Fe-4S dicluster domain-containing protein [Thermoflexia bacterium]|nr:4Fe-4S dicluster domain-containing protein [Thermoflexia bacterium]